MESIDLRWINVNSLKFSISFNNIMFKPIFRRHPKKFKSHNLLMLIIIICVCVCVCV